MPSTLVPQKDMTVINLGQNSGRTPLFYETTVCPRLRQERIQDYLSKFRYDGKLGPFFFVTLS